MRARPVRLVIVAIILTAAAFTGLPVTVAAAAGTWTLGSSLDGSTIMSVFCVSSTFCVAGTDNGNVYFFDGSGWAAAATEPSGASIGSVSCASSTFCLASAGDGALYETLNGGNTWLSVATGGFLAVSCGGPSLCVASDQSGDVEIWNGSAWSSHVIDAGQPLQVISCAGASFCATVDELGNAFTYNGSAWSEQAGADPDGFPASVSCASSSFCVATDSGGDAMTYNGATWSTPAPIAPGGHNPVVDCVTTSFCMGVDNLGYAMTYNGSAWSGLSQVDTSAITSVSCPSLSYCLAGDENGDYLTYSGGATQPSPGRYQLGEVVSPRAGSRWKAGSRIPIATTVTYASGERIPADVAANLAAGCAITVSAAGARHLRTHCLSFDPTTGLFGYRWQTSRGRGGTTVISVHLTTPPGMTRWTRITMTKVAAPRRG